MKISIIGCGWLGLPLGKFLAEQGHELLGSTTSEEKLALIEEAGVQPVLMKLSPMPMGKNFNKLFESELLIVNIPPRRKKNPPEYYMEQIKFLRYLVDNLKNRDYILYFHNDPLTMSGSKSIKERSFLLNNCYRIVFNSNWSKKRFLQKMKSDAINSEKLIVINQSASKNKINFNNKKKF